MFNNNETLRYARHFSLQDFGLEGQKKLKAAKVLCVGCGGLASTVVMYLAAAGVGLLGIMDDDVVDESNLQRQVLFKTSEIGVKKVVATEKRILELNPNVQVKAYPIQLNEVNALAIIKEFDVIVDCTDNFHTKYLINDACFEQKKAFVYGSVFQFEGQLSFFDGKNSPCFRCLFSEPPALGMISNCAEEGVLGVLPGLIGTLQAIEVIKHIVGLGESLLSRLFFFDTLRTSASSLEFGQSASCPICHDKKGFSELIRPKLQECSLKDVKAISVQDLSQRLEDVFLIDVREESERQICNIGGVLIPLKDFESAIDGLDRNKTIVVYCKSGRRSQEATRLLVDAGFNQAFFLEGGILSWIDKINPDLTRY